MPVMTRAPVVLFLALVLGACVGDALPPEPSPDTLDTISALDDRVAGLESDLLAAEQDRSKIDERVAALADKLDRALERLKETIETTRSGSAEARDSATSALANAQAIASELSVLEERYDYHLRRYHGGGG